MPGDDRDENQPNATENEGGERPQYHHDAEHGETRYVSDSERSEPHSALNRPVADVEAAADLQRVGLGDNVPEAEPTSEAEAGDGEDDAGTQRSQ